MRVCGQTLRNALGSNNDVPASTVTIFALPMVMPEVPLGILGGGSPKMAQEITLRLFIPGSGKHVLRRIEFDQFSQIHKGCIV